MYAVLSGDPRLGNPDFTPLIGMGSKFSYMADDIFKLFSRDSIPLFLAPQAGVSESPFRRICRRFGADIVSTEAMVLFDRVERRWKKHKCKSYRMI